MQMTDFHLFIFLFLSSSLSPLSFVRIHPRFPTSTLPHLSKLFIKPQSVQSTKYVTFYGDYHPSNGNPQLDIKHKSIKKKHLWKWLDLQLGIHIQSGGKNAIWIEYVLDLLISLQKIFNCF